MPPQHVRTLLLRRRHGNIMQKAHVNVAEPNVCACDKTQLIPTQWPCLASAKRLQAASQLRHELFGSSCLINGHRQVLGASWTWFPSSKTLPQSA